MAEIFALFRCFLNQLLIAFNLALASTNQSLRAQHFPPQLSCFAHRLLVLLVNGGFLPARKHNDEVKFANALLSGRFSLIFPEGFQKRIMFIFFAFVHQFESVGLLSNHSAHVFVRKHGTSGFSQARLHAFIVLFQFLCLLLLDHGAHLFFENLDGLLVVEIVSLEGIVFFL